MLVRRLKALSAVVDHNFSSLTIWQSEHPRHSDSGLEPDPDLLQAILDLCQLLANPVHNGLAGGDVDIEDAHSCGEIPDMKSMDTLCSISLNNIKLTSPVSTAGGEREEDRERIPDGEVRGSTDQYRYRDTQQGSMIHFLVRAIRVAAQIPVTEERTYSDLWQYAIRFRSSLP